MRLATLTVTLLLALAAPASATTVSWSPAPPDNAPTPEESCSRYMACPPPSIRVSGEPGEANDITIMTDPAGRIVVRDAGATVKPTKDCPAEPGGGVACPAAGDRFLGLGDGDDKADVVGWTIAGGAGNDVITGSYVDGGEGDDAITGTVNGDTLTGGPGRDVIRGAAGADTIAEGEAVPEGDVLDGGDGIDRIAFTGRALPVLIDLAEPEQAGSENERNVVSGFEEALGGDGADTILGSPAVASPAAPPTYLIGAKGDDRIVDRSSGRSWLQGESGDDTLLAAGGADVLEGGEGRDRLSGGDDRDALNGDAGNDTLLGGAGNDFLSGGAGADGLDGGAGDDVLLGEAGRDRLIGRAGADRLTGGGGADLVLAGDGADVLLLHDGLTDRASCGRGSDRVVADRRDRTTSCERRRLR